MKKLLIIGSHQYFINIVDACKEIGVVTIVCDGFIDGPAKKIADHYYDIDVADIDKIIDVAKKEKVDGVISGFNDELMSVQIKVANELNLPSIINTEQLKLFTDKYEMKKLFVENNIPTSKFKVIGKENSYDIEGLAFPLIMKPVDGSGSKGIYIAKNLAEFNLFFNDCLLISNDKKVIIEEFYEGDEIQGMFWINNTETRMLYMGDRELVSLYPNRPGKPKRLLYPSRHLYQYQKQIEEIGSKICKIFDISNGLLYMQFMVGKDGIKLTEIMPRLPGGCDYRIIEQMTSVSIISEFIKFLIGDIVNFDLLKIIPTKNNKVGFAIPIYCQSEKIAEIDNADTVSKKEWVFDLLLLRKEGDFIPKTGDMRQDIGRVFCVTENLYLAKKYSDEFEKLFKVKDANGINIISNLNGSKYE